MIYSCYSEGKDLITHERQSKVAVELLRIGLMAEYGIVEDEMIRSLSGKPSLLINRDIKLSIAHCRCAVTVILSKSPVGIDIERVRRFSPHAAKRVLSEEELAALYEKSKVEDSFFRYWTLKESYIKALGCGFSYPVRNFHVSIKGEQIETNRPFACFHILEGKTGFITSICHLRHEDFKEEEIREIKITIP